MAITCGYYNSNNGDRKYDAKQHCAIFDGIINDGVFMSVGDALFVTAGGGMTTILGTGRCWFNSTWTLNDALYPLNHDPSSTIYDRIDTWIVDIFDDDSVRNNTFYILKGTPATNPVPPALINIEGHHQYRLADIRIPKNSNEITTANISIKVGQNDCPFVTGILETINIDALIAQWEAEWDIWAADTEAETTKLLEDIKAELDRLNAGTEVMLKTDYAPDATAVFNQSANRVEITSNYAKVRGIYNVTFIAPTALPVTTGNQLAPYIIDGEEMFLYNGDRTYDLSLIYDGSICTFQVDKVNKKAFLVSPSYGSNVSIGIHVATTGSDTTGDGTEANPFKTIQNAINSLPKEIVRTTTIYIAPGTYNEDLSLTNFYGGASLNIAKKTGATGIVSIKSITCTSLLVYLGINNITIHGMNSSGRAFQMGTSGFAYLLDVVMSGSGKSLNIYASGNAQLLCQNLILSGLLASGTHVQTNNGGRITMIGGAYNGSSTYVWSSNNGGYICVAGYPTTSSRTRNLGGGGLIVLPSGGAVGT